MPTYRVASGIYNCVTWEGGLVTSRSTDYEIEGSDC